MEKDGNVVEYEYCPLGKRTGRRWSGVSGSGEQKFFYNGDNLFVIEETLSGKKRTKQVLCGLFVDEVYGEISDTASRWFFQDRLGTVRMEMDDQGKITKTRRYRAFGEEAAGAVSGIGYTGREYDELSDLYFYRSRFYDQKLGRFTQRDFYNEQGLLTGAGDVVYNPLQHNDWVYVGNGAENYGDPYGLKITCQNPALFSACQELNNEFPSGIDISVIVSPDFGSDIGGYVFPYTQTIFFSPSDLNQPQYIQQVILYHEIVHCYQNQQSLLPTRCNYYLKESVAYMAQYAYIKELIESKKVELSCDVGLKNQLVHYAEVIWEEYKYYQKKLEENCL